MAIMCDQARILFHRWPDRPGSCRFCGATFDIGRGSTHYGRLKYCGEAHYHLFGIVRLLVSADPKQAMMRAFDPTYPSFLDADA
jgi:hypothetical protein